MPTPIIHACIDCAALPERPPLDELDGTQYRPRLPRPTVAGGIRSRRCATHARVHQLITKTRTREVRIQRVYGLSADEQRDLWEYQGQACGGCGRQPRLRAPQTDHDHTCCPAGSSCGRCVRGLTCMPCNELMGRYTLEQLRQVVAYLEDPPLARMRRERGEQEGAA